MAYPQKEIINDDDENNELSEISLLSNASDLDTAYWVTTNETAGGQENIQKSIIFIKI